jgi:hypothetical protein
MLIITANVDFELVDRNRISADVRAVQSIAMLNRSSLHLAVTPHHERNDGR